MKKFLKENKSEIAFGVGIGMFIFGMIFAAKGARKADAKIEERKKTLKVEELPVKEELKIKVVSQIPSAVCAATAMGLTGYSKITDLGKIAEVAGIAGMYSHKFSELKAKVEEKIGKPQTKKIVDDIKREDAERTYPTDKSFITDGYGTILCRDASFGGWFWCKGIDDIKSRVRDQVNLRIRLTGEGVSQNDIYELMGRDCVGTGNDVMFTKEIDFDFTPQLLNDGRDHYMVMTWYVDGREI